MSNKKEVTKDFKDNYNIELANIDKLTVDEIKPALSGTHDFIKDFPEAGKFIKRIEYYPGLSGRHADMGGDGLMRIRKDVLKEKGIRKNSKEYRKILENDLITTNYKEEEYKIGEKIYNYIKEDSNA